MLLVRRTRLRVGIGLLLSEVDDALDKPPPPVKLRIRDGRCLRRARLASILLLSSILRTPSLLSDESFLRISSLLLDESLLLHKCLLRRRGSAKCGGLLILHACQQVGLKPGIHVELGGMEVHCVGAVVAWFHGGGGGDKL